MRLDSAGRKFKESDKAQGSPDGSVKPGPQYWILFDGSRLNH